MERSARWRNLLGAITVAAVTLVPGAPTSADTRDEAPLLHKYVRIETAATVPAGMSTLPGPGGPDDLPSAILEGGEVLPAPSLRRPPGDIPTPGRNAFSVPDRETAAEDRLEYEAVFNPTVAPFKRLAAFDDVGAGPSYRLGVSDDSVTPVPVAEAADSSGRERFWGTTTVALSPDARSELPSVAPGMRILRYRTEPRVELAFGRDGADNYFVTAPALPRSKRVRVVMLVDAPSSYFRGPLPVSATLADVPVSLRPEARPALQKRVRRKVLPRLGIEDPELMAVTDLVSRMALYFRAFEANDDPPAAAGSGGDLYLDLTLSKHGVCRHRAFGFVATAHALGLPARYIANEAHAFVEVYFPGDEVSPGGWRRIDLGGEAGGLDVRNAGDRAVHDPGEDPFPRPEEYTRHYSARAAEAPRDPAARAGFGAVRGLRDAGRAGSPLSGRRDDDDDPPPRLSGDGSAGSGITDPAGPAAAPRDPDGTRMDGSRTDAPSPAVDTRPVTTLRVHSDTDSVMRGERVGVSGRLADDAGEPMARRPVMFFLVREDFELTIGSTVTDSTGHFELEVLVPASMAAGRYELEAFYPGEADHRPAVAR